jgi:hypothetical protein
MILEIVKREHEGDNAVLNSDEVERTHNVRSIKLRAGPDGTYRLNVDTPRSGRGTSIDPDCEYIEIFDDDAHRGRGSAVCGADETWQSTVLTEEQYALLHDIAHHDPDMTLATTGDVLERAIEEFLARQDLDECPECGHHVTQFWVDDREHRDHPVAVAEPCGCTHPPNLAPDPIGTENLEAMKEEYGVDAPLAVEMFRAGVRPTVGGDRARKVVSRFARNADLVAAALREAAHQYQSSGSIDDDHVDVDAEDVATLHDLANKIEAVVEDDTPVPKTRPNEEDLKRADEGELVRELERREYDVPAREITAGGDDD